ncbi:MAG TPA: mannitol dehydrogenase family protein [Myxococcota bacterium]|nr:mannitol dehydrogenase family protein [Myxococcota bacterium]
MSNKHGTPSGHAAVKLSAATLSSLKASPKSAKVPTPSYDRKALREGIVHFGVGGFHRAHLAVYIDALIREHGVKDWAICGVGLMPGDAAMRDALVSQDGLYTVIERSAAGESPRVIGSLTSYLFAPADPEAVIAKLASPSTRIVSLTITESGYYTSEATGELDTTHPDIAHDLSTDGAPRTVYGYIVAALARRRAAGLNPFTVMSCDNVQQNGHMVRRMLLSFARGRDQAVAEWLAAKGAFPNSMVDRITPRTTPENKRGLERDFGIDDAWPVVSEPFLQWVIEDAFSDGRPDWEKVGVQMVDEVEHYELMKLRLLNASHSAMGYLGHLAGYTYIHEVINDPQFNRYIRALMKEEVRPLLPAIAGIDLDAYCATLIERFANPTIQDQVMRICLDGSGKIPKFVLGSVRDQLARPNPSLRRLSLCVASWFRFLTGVDENGKAFPIEDPLAAQLQAAAKKGGKDPAALLAIRQVFGDDLPKAQPFVDEVCRALVSLYDDGARATLAKYLE